MAEYDLKPAEKQAFFITLRRLAGSYGRLPDSMMITEKIEVSGGILASSGLSDVRSGVYMGQYPVAVKTMRVAALDDLLRMRKVCTNVGPGRDLNHSAPEILQRSHPLEHVIPSQRHETCWSSGGHGERTIRHRDRVDGARKHHGLH